jgi:hypothetical protein
MMILAQGHIDLPFDGSLVFDDFGLMPRCQQWVRLLKFQETQRRVQTALQNAMASTVGVGDTGSGVIVSPNGLVLTAAHVSGVSESKDHLQAS